MSHSSAIFPTVHAGAAHSFSPQKELTMRAIAETPPRTANIVQFDYRSAIASLRAPHIRLRDGVINIAGPSSRFGYMAATAGRLSSERSAILGLLLEATLPATYQGHATLQPIWANEAMQRAYTTISLVKTLDEAVPVRQCHRITASQELALARELSALLKSTSYTQPEAPAPCSRAIRTAVQNLVELFSPAKGDVRATTCIEPVTLPAFQARALILLANSLVISALRHALHTPTGGRIMVTLDRPTPSTACLIVTDTGNSWIAPTPDPASVAHDLASLLDATANYSAAPNGGTSVSVSFSIRN
jgi:hypothetical protein